MSSYPEIRKDVKPRLYTLAEASIYASTSRQTLYKEAAAGRLKMVKIGSQASRIEVAELDRWLEARIAEHTH